MERAKRGKRGNGRVRCSEWDRRKDRERGEVEMNERDYKKVVLKTNRRLIDSQISELGNLIEEAKAGR